MLLFILNILVKINQKKKIKKKIKLTINTKQINIKNKIFIINKSYNDYKNFFLNF